ncbi:lysophospholipid acyltransferase family protein [Streptomyces sp. NPDC005648]|uniref:lysophospholipid acyltransferase family protein n=1 Tax=Streptomyces sp. NPDC005648 TaxID=3157044 RepID=UPI0033B3680E
MPSAPCTPGACIEQTGSATAVPRAVARIAAVVVLMLVGIALTPLGGRIPAEWVRRWCRLIVRAAGVRVRVTGAAAPAIGGVLLVANHISWLDIPLLAAVRPARMLAKSDIRDWPVAGPLAARGGVLFIDRNRLRALPDTVSRIAGALRSGQAVGVFPEGSTWCGRAQGPFRRAVFQAALDAEVPVQPVHLGYRVADGPASTAPAFIGEDSLLASVWRVAMTRGLVAEVEVRETIPAGAHPDRRSLARAAQPGATDRPDWTHAALAAAARPTGPGRRETPGAVRRRGIAVAFAEVTGRTRTAAARAAGSPAADA